MDIWSWFQFGQRGVHPESRTSRPLRGLRARVRIELDYANLDSVQFSRWTFCSELGGRLDSVSLSSALAAPVSTWTVSLGIEYCVKNLRDLVTAVLTELCLNGIHRSTCRTVG